MVRFFLFPLPFPSAFGGQQQQEQLVGVDGVWCWTLA